MNVELPIDLLYDAISGLQAFGLDTGKETLRKLIIAATQARRSCPFCGHRKACFWETVQRGQGVIKCEECGATGPESSGGATGASLEWNKRVAEKQD